MTGVIWIIQLLNYPFMRYVKLQEFVDFHLAHSSRITWIVGPAMILQISSAFYLLTQEATNKYFISFFILSLSVFLATFFLSVPQHNILALGFDQQAYEKLVSTNWVRTFFWSLNTLIAFYYFTTRFQLKT